MKRILTVLVLGAAVVLAACAVAATPQAGKASASKAAPGPVTLKGEIVDMGCYVGHEARGAKHKECATKCIAGGMPMGLLTADNTLYLITLDHDNADPYTQAKSLAGETVEATGTVSQRAGVKALDLTAVKVSK